MIKRTLARQTNLARYFVLNVGSVIDYCFVYLKVKGMTLTHLHVLLYIIKLITLRLELMLQKKTCHQLWFLFINLCQEQEVSQHQSQETLRQGKTLFSSELLLGQFSVVGSLLISSMYSLIHSSESVRFDRSPKSPAPRHRQF